ncbi:methyltransferase regulatory domain-containing protein [Candidatus Berkiella aquae]|uniref:Class I SAM-dependent methyltransferase n=1 Tax=Candidatus Berkiella aquae TaxID=295108 RepID=A0AAE3L6W0_9GAMM|nr:class I SAM-dependent methyltransferase [Candidatus Berkiella aquae]MCS5710897.1 class I SAM-dependent methyltransferase [Candidatus Berkiella aquae]
MMTTSATSMTAERILEDEYNKTPYQSFPFSHTHPTHLFTLATLFGLKPKPVEKARILEIGCASGGNLIPIGYHFPTSECLGIDISEKQIDDGIKQLVDMDIKNVTLRHQSLLEFDTKDGKFDYIICHGVYSWVDNEARRKILQICHDNLSKNGIAYISYNTFPGWNMVNSVRALMMWHTKNIANPAEKASQARSVLKFIGDGLQEDKSPYATFLRNEIQLLSMHADSYLLHEHLSSYNDPVYFHQFMDQANQAKLSYLADAFLSLMFTENLPPQFASELKKINNIVTTGQYMDFIRNQRFRCTLLCHQEQQINRSLKTVDIENFYLQFTGKTDRLNLSERDVGQDDISFSNAAVTLKLRNSLSQLAMVILYQEQFKPMHYKELCEQMMLRSSTKDLAFIKHHLNEELNLMRTVLAGLINISSYPGDYQLTLTEKPTACPYARYQATFQQFATNRRHQAIRLDPLGKSLLPLLDGTHALPDLINHAFSEVKAGRLNLLDKDKRPITDEELVRQQLKMACENVLNNFAKQALLV